MTRASYRASPTALLILRAALWEGDAAARAWRRVAATADIETLDPGSARLLPLIHAKAHALGVESPWLDRIRGIYRYWWAHNQVLVRLSAAAITELEGVGVRTMLLKGVPLGIVYYGDPALRPMSDFDILVRPGDTRLVLQTLSGMGWLPERRVDRTYQELLHGVSLHDRTGRTLDLHWAIHEEDVRTGADDDAWATAISIDVAGTPTQMLAPAPLLVHAMSSGAKWAEDPAVRWLADAALIVGRGDVDWRAFVDEVVRRRFVVRAQACLAYLQGALHVAIPDDVSAALRATPVSSFERFEHRVRTTRHARFGELPRYWLAWTRRSPAAWRDVLGFGQYLRCAWDLPSVAAVPRAAVARGMRRLATGRAPDRPEPAPRLNGRVPRPPR